MDPFLTLLKRFLQGGMEKLHNTSYSLAQMKINLINMVNWLTNQNFALKLKAITFHQNLFTHFSNEHPSISLSDLIYAASLEAVPVMASSLSLDARTVQQLGNTDPTCVTTGTELYYWTA